MSTPRKTTKTDAKRRAAARRRNRELGRHIFAYTIVAILVISTFSAIIVPQVLVEETNDAVAPTPTQEAGSGVAALVTRGDEAAAEERWEEAVSFYSAYLGQNPADAEVHFKLGKAYTRTQPPDYPAALDHLQRALNIAPDAAFAAEANTLIQQYSASITATVPVTGTTSVTATQPISP